MKQLLTLRGEEEDVGVAREAAEGIGAATAYWELSRHHGTECVIEYGRQG